MNGTDDGANTVEIEAKERYACTSFPVFFFFFSVLSSGRLISGSSAFAMSVDYFFFRAEFFTVAYPHQRCRWNFVRRLFLRLFLILFFMSTCMIRYIVLMF